MLLSNYEDKEVKPEKLTDQWETPKYIYKRICEAFSFEPDTDAFASAQNTKCAQFFTREMDALSIDWAEYGACNTWVQPPYSSNILKPAVFKAHKEALENEIESLALLPCSVDTEWFHTCVLEPKMLHVFTRGRIHFIPPPGITASTPSGGNLVVLFSSRNHRLRQDAIQTLFSDPEFLKK